MTDNAGARRRHFLQLGSVAIAGLPFAVLSGKAAAATNANMRAALKYQPTPNGDKACSKCSQFVPGKTPGDQGGCKLLAGDTEIAPSGVAWHGRPKQHDCSSAFMRLGAQVPHIALAIRLSVRYQFDSTLRSLPSAGIMPSTQ